MKFTVHNLDTNIHTSSMSALCIYHKVAMQLTCFFVIRRVCGQTLGLGLGQNKDIVVVFY